MQISYKWLKSYIDFPYNPSELAHKLTMAGLEVEEVEFLGKGLEDIVVGKIEEIKEHPNADKLVVCKVNTGKDRLQVVTGAPNVKEGIKVPVAGTGVTLPTGMKIEETVLRGKASRGMICSKDELGLMEERAEGIMVLADEAEVGKSIIEHLNLDDYVLKLDLTPNYARCLGMIGIAREIKAILGNEVNYPENSYDQSVAENINDYVDVEIADPDLCPRYTGILIKDIEIKDSPDWMQRRLKASGIRPINNIVDITNYVLLEYNQPLHAFDYETVKGKKIIVRRAEEGEEVVTLDDQERRLDSDVLVIADQERAIGLAGVMGAANSEVTADTRYVFLESAFFNPVNIRKTARKLGIPSEASHRFERGVDIGNVIEAGKRAAYLMQEYAGGKVVSGIIDKYPEPSKQGEIELDVDHVNTILGIELSAEKMSKLLSRLEFEVEQVNDNILKVNKPSYRNDVGIEADLIEEIARMYGYNRIPVTRPESLQMGKKNEKQKLEDRIKSIFQASGMDEVYTFSLMDEKLYDKLNIPEDDKLRQWVKIKNPLNRAFSLLRTSLLPGVVEVLANNAKRQIAEMKIFELGKVFRDQGKNERPLEKFMIAGGSMGAKEDPYNVNAADFFYLKGVLENLFIRLEMDDIRFEPAEENSYLHPGRSAEVYHGDQKMGFVGELAPEIIEEFDLIERTTVFQLDFSLIQGITQFTEFKYVKIPRHPAVSRDLALLVDENLTAASLLSEINRAGGELLRNCDIFDLYQGDQIPEGKKSIAFELTFRARDRTLTDEEVNEVFETIINSLENKFTAEVRGN